MIYLDSSIFWNSVDGIVTDTNAEMKQLQNNIELEVTTWMTDLMLSIESIDFSIHDYHPPVYNYSSNTNLSAEANQQSNSAQVLSLSLLLVLLLMHHFMLILYAVIIVIFTFD